MFVAHVCLSVCLFGRPNLQTLSLAATLITDDALLSLRRCTQLTSLTAGTSSACRLRAQRLCAAAAARIDLFGCKFTNDDACMAVSKVTSLRTLGRGYCARVSDRGVRALAALPVLATLDVAHASVTDAGAFSFVFICKRVCLHSLFVCAVLLAQVCLLLTIVQALFRLRNNCHHLPRSILAVVLASAPLAFANCRWCDLEFCFFL